MPYVPTVDSETGERYLPVAGRGRDVLKDPILNKGTAFTRRERSDLGLDGLLPAHVTTMTEQMLRVRDQLDHKKSALERNIYLAGLQDRNETLFYRFVSENLAETVPILYTPTVAKACSHWSQIFRRSRGTYVTPEDRGRIPEVLRARETTDAAIVVVTDNERILGIGDQGAGGMGIPIGKLALYTTAAGIHPARCVPISLDVGTDNEELLADPLYLGLRRPRLRGDEYWDLAHEFVLAVQEVYPDAILQWEDFSNRTSLRLLDTYRRVLPSFNDDIQGTAAMVVGGLLAAARATGVPLRERTIVMAGAGSAGLGIREQIVAQMISEGADRREAESRVLTLDSKGLVVKGAPATTGHKTELAVDPALLAGWDAGDPPSLLDVVRNARPDVLIGVSGQGGLFTEEVVREMAQRAERPLLLPLSNPTANTEVTAPDAIAWTDGRALVATGSPFDAVEHHGRRHAIGQANNVFIFPGFGLGSIVVRAREITIGMFLAAARSLADCVTDSQLAGGRLYPAIEDVREVSRRVAIAVAAQAISEGQADPIDDIETAVDAAMWYPEYLPYRAA